MLFGIYIMTMHMIRGLSTDNTKKRKSKTTKKQHQQRLEDWKKDNKWRKQNHHRVRSFEEYEIALFGGKVKNEFRDLKPKKVYRRETQKINSLDTNIGSTPRQEPKTYDGERKLIGIAVMHKSNLVPVFDEQSAKDISRMRR